MKLTLPRWDALPEIDLYLEQIITLLDKWLGESLCEPDKSVLTKTMINNYVKHKIITPPINKKYDKITVASLFVIAIYKPLCTMEEIKKLIDLAIKVNEPSISYDQFCNVVEESVEAVFSGKGFEGRGELTDAQYILRVVSRGFACQFFLRKNFLDNNNEEE